MAVEGVVGEGDEGRALPAEGHVGGAEVGDGRDTRERGDDGTVTQLECGGDRLAKKISWLALMEDGLAVVADQVDLFRGDAEFLAGSERGFGVDVAEAGMKLAEFSWRERVLFGQVQDFFADLPGEGLVRVAKE